MGGKDLCKGFAAAGFAAQPLFISENYKLAYFPAFFTFIFINRHVFLLFQSMQAPTLMAFACLTHREFREFVFRQQDKIVFYRTGDGPEDLYSVCV